VRRRTLPQNRLSGDGYGEQISIDNKNRYRRAASSRSAGEIMLMANDKSKHGASSGICLSSVAASDGTADAGRGEESKYIHHRHQAWNILLWRGNVGDTILA